MEEGDIQELLKKLGGESGCKSLAKEFYSRVSREEKLKRLFPGKSLRCATEEFSAFLIQFLDGDESLTQYRWWLSIRESHGRFHISDKERSAWLETMKGALEAQIGDAELRRQLSVFFQIGSAYMIGKDEGEVDDEALRCAWSRQLSLDRLIQVISDGCEDEVLETATRFADRPSVFVGILESLMADGRPSWEEFVLKMIDAKPELAGTQYNGRTLLHLACGCGLPRVVEALLTTGIDPDIPDHGGHSPLYYTGGMKRPKESASVVRILAAAGARINHAGGVSRSTALHQAARFGNLPAAQALLGVGASLDAKDKKGFTPLDRARNCRRHELASYLSNEMGLGR